VRKSFPEEEAKFETAFARAVAAGDADREDEEGYLVYLVAVRDPTDEDENPS
jgi:hypothetical protein